MDALNVLEGNLQILITRYQNMERELQQLKVENAAQREEILRTHSELNTLQQQYRALTTACGLIGSDEERLKAKQQLTNLIAQVDRAINVLNQ